MDDVRQELLERLEMLTPGQQRQVLNYTRQLLGERPKGIPGKELLKFAGTIPPEALEEMKQAIEEEWRQVRASAGSPS